MRILDSDICVEILRGRREVITRRRDLPDRVATTWVTAAELYYGAAKSSAPADNRHLVGQFLQTLDILGLDSEAVARFGVIRAELEDRGERLEDADLFIASIALAHEAVLVTGNQKHYQRIQGLEIEDWIRPGDATETPP